MRIPLSIMVLAAAALSACGTDAATTTPTTPGPQSQIGQAQTAATGSQATQNLMTAEAAMQNCGDGTTPCTQQQLVQAEPSLADAFNLGAKPGGMAMQSLQGGGFRLLGYGGTQGGTAFITYTLEHGPDGTRTTSCTPPDQIACPNGRWPGTGG